VRLAIVWGERIVIVEGTSRAARDGPLCLGLGTQFLRSCIVAPQCSRSHELFDCRDQQAHVAEGVRIGACRFELADHTGGDIVIEPRGCQPDPRT
jgi:hypothetical protein